MKIKISNKKPFRINGTTKVKITVEVGDVFVDVNNNYKAIEYIKNGNIAFRDTVGDASIEAISDDLFSKYKFAGTINDDNLPMYEDALSISK